jgi:Na+-driven multidrug efflux pump
MPREAFMLGAAEPVQEAPMTSGLILLAFLGILVAFFVTRMRRRMGLGVTGSTWAVIIALFAIVVLGMWVSSQH